MADYQAGKIVALRGNKVEVVFEDRDNMVKEAQLMEHVDSPSLGRMALCVFLPDTRDCICIGLIKS